MNRDEQRLEDALKAARTMEWCIRNLLCKCGHGFWIHSRDSVPDGMRPGCLSLLIPGTNRSAAHQCRCPFFVPVTPEDLEVVVSGIQL